jgi:hypothetical protein
MAEGVEARPAVVAAHSALPHASEGDVVGAKMNDGVVDTAAAKERAPVTLRSTARPAGKQVEGQGLWLLLQAAMRHPNYRKSKPADWAEDLSPITGSSSVTLPEPSLNAQGLVRPPPPITTFCRSIRPSSRL